MSQLQKRIYGIRRLSTPQRTRKGILTIVDQAVSSTSNILIVMAIARVTSPSYFGLIALLLTGVYTGVAITRQALGTPLMLANAKGQESVRHAAQRSLSVSLLFGAVIGSAILLCGYILGEVGIAAAVATAAPFVLAQDIYRIAAISLDRSALALLWDGIWAAISGLILVATWRGADELTGILTVYIWGICAAICAVGLGAMARIGPQVTSIVQWWRQNLRHRIRFGSEAAIGSLTVLSVSTLVAFIIGPAATGALRGAGIVFGPLNILISAIPLIIVPDSARARDTLAQVWRRLWPFASLLSLVALTVALLGYVLPARIGQLFLGESWEQVRPLLPFTGLEYLALAWLSCNRTALQVSAMSREILHLRVIFAVTSVGLSATAAFYFGTAQGVAAALATTALLMLLPNLKVARDNTK
jgi:O-antigen/teichoic acid export membrane protein